MKYLFWIYQPAEGMSSNLTIRQRVRDYLNYINMDHTHMGDLILHWNVYISILCTPFLLNKYKNVSWGTKISQRQHSVHAAMLDSYECNNIPFGLKTAVATFQWLMEKILNDMPNCFTYINDVFMYTSE